MNDFEEALVLIAANEGQADFDGRQDPELVTAAAEALGVKLPPTYERFLRELGVGGFAGDEFYGVIRKDWSPSVPDAVGTTLRHRATSQLPATYVIIADTGMGEFYVLDTAVTNADGEAPVLIWMPGVPPADAGTPERVADSFGSFFLARIRDALAT
jgi:hypothetical protein